MDSIGHMGEGMGSDRRLFQGKTPRLGALVAAAMFWAGCDTPAPTPPPTLSGDARVFRQNIRHDAPFDLVEVWRRGHSADDLGVEFFSLSAVAVASDGTHLVLDRGNHRVVRLSGNGDPLGEFGREGEGPGEWQDAFQMTGARDTLAILDSNNRIHFFRTDGALLNTFQLSFDDPEVHGGSQVSASESGWFVSGSGFFRTGPDGESLQPVMREVFYSVDPGDGRMAPSGLHWAREWIGTMETGLGAQPILAASPSGDTDGAGRFIVADTSSYRIDIYGFDGTQQVRRLNQVERLPITDDLIAMWRASRNCPEGPIEMVECSSATDRLIESLPREEFRPVVQRVRAFPNGHFAALRWDLDPNPFDRESSSIYDYFDADGTFMGFTTGLIPLWFDGEHIVAVQTDSLDVQSLVRYRLNPGR